MNYELRFYLRLVDCLSIMPLCVVAGKKLSLFLFFNFILFGVIGGVGGVTLTRFRVFEYQLVYESEACP